MAFVAAESDNDMGMLSQGCQIEAFWRPATDLSFPELSETPK